MFVYKLYYNGMQTDEFDEFLFFIICLKFLSRTNDEIFV